MNVIRSVGMKQLLSRVGRWDHSCELLLSAGLVGFLVLWVLLAGAPLSIGGLLLLATYVAGGCLWTSIAQFSWPSRSSCLAYYPIGFGISTGLCTLLLLARLGLICSLLLAMLIAVVVCFVAPWSGRQSSLFQNDEKNVRNLGACLLISGASLLLLTALFSSQLQSASTLTSLAGDTSLLAWNDYIAHARTTLEIATAQFGGLPQSSLNPQLRVSPYHYGHYILPALLLNQGLSVSSLQAYTALAPAFGAFLLLMPILERFRLAGIARIVEVLPFSSAAMLAYSAWLHFAADTFVDPIWLLVAGPGTMYAAAVLLSLLQIYVTRSPCIKGRDLVSLVVVVGMLLLLHKIHLLHSFAIFLLLLLVVGFCAADGNALAPSGWRWLGIRRNRYLSAAAAGSFLLLSANFALQMNREHMVKDFLANALKFTEYFSGLTFDTYNISGYAFSAADILYLLVCSLVGIAVMAGPLFGMAVLLSRHPSLERNPLSPDVAMDRLLLALLGSLLIAIFLAPVPPWWPDSSEFQNRVWPVLWSIALWFLAGLRLPVDAPALRFFMIALQVIVLIGCVQLVPTSKRLSITAASKISDAYPTIMPLSAKRIALELQATNPSYRFFASKEPFGSRDNELYALTLSALSGRLPLYAMPNQQALKGSPSIQADWREAVSMSAAACSGQARIGALDRRRSLVAAVEQGPIQFVAVCR